MSALGTFRRWASIVASVRLRPQARTRTKTPNSALQHMGPFVGSHRSGKKPDDVPSKRACWTSRCCHLTRKAPDLSRVPRLNHLRRGGTLETILVSDLGTPHTTQALRAFSPAPSDPSRGTHAYRSVASVSGCPVTHLLTCADARWPGASWWTPETSRRG